MAAAAAREASVLEQQSDADSSAVKAEEQTNLGFNFAEQPIGVISQVCSRTCTRVAVRN